MTPVSRPKPVLYPAEKTESNRRYGRVISNTVDTWARQADPDHSDYKPLIFGGTYPIEVPTSPAQEAKPTAHVKPDFNSDAHRRELRKTIEQSLDKFEALMAKREMDKETRRKIFSKRTVETFDIDEPMDPNDPPLALVKKKDVKYYMSGPKTFDIDAPVSFI